MTASSRGWRRPEIREAPPRALVITGFHRSGTSLFAEYLDRAGLFIGFNVKQGGHLPLGSRTGHHEDQAMVSLQRAALKRTGVELYPSDGSGVPVRFDAQEQETARDLIEQRSKHRRWGWKSPSTCLLLEAWDSLLDDARFAFMLRHPMQAADSLLRRGRDRHITHDPRIGLQAWTVYNREVLRFTRRHVARCRLIELDSLVSAPEAVIEELNRAFDMGLAPVDFGEVFEGRYLFRQVSSRLAPTQKRAPELFAEAETLYAQLQRLAWQPPRLG